LRAARKALSVEGSVFSKNIRDDFLTWIEAVEKKNVISESH
jgi:hypothetical protein